MSLRYDPVGDKCLKEQVGLRRLEEYTRGSWGGTFLGIFACRSVRGGTTPSMHSEGRAYDWRAPNRSTLDQAIDFCIQNANALSIQVVIDYQNDQRWQVNKGWKKFGGQDPGGSAWHVERNWDGAKDARSIDEILKNPSVPVVVSKPLPQYPAVEYSEDNVKTKLIAIPLDQKGNGWTNWDPGFSRAPVPVSVEINGPYPPTDTYWFEDDATRPEAAIQQRGNELIVSVVNGKPVTTINVWVSAA